MPEDHFKGSQGFHNKANPDRHKDGSGVIAVRLPGDQIDQLKELIARSPLPHDTVGGYIAWVLRTQVFRKR